MPAHDGGAAHTGAGVRKPPRAETAGDLARPRVRRYRDLVPAACCRSAVNGGLGSDRGGDATVRPIAIGGTGFAKQRSSDKMAIQDGATASLVIAGREPAKESPAILPRTDLDHDVSILMTAAVLLLPNSLDALNNTHFGPVCRSKGSSGSFNRFGLVANLILARMIPEGRCRLLAIVAHLSRVR